MEKKLFATYEGKEINEYILKNEFIEAHIINFGAILKNLIFEGVEVVCGFDTFEDYLTDTSYQGSIVGRYANRIKGAEFSLNGKTYKLSLNEKARNNLLHGGFSGFNRKVWNVENASSDSVTLSLFSPDGDEGFPANLNVKVTYKIDGSAIAIDYEATPDADTVIGMTNHSYFNLNGCSNGTVHSQKIRINADEYSAVDKNLIPVGHRSVENTPFDLRELTEIGKWVGEDFSGYDHNFILNESEKVNIAGFSLPLAAEATNDKITLSVYTDQPCVQIYAGVALGGTPLFRNNGERVNHGAFCVEAQIEPNSPNMNQGFIKGGETYRQTTVYKLSKN